jgi:Ca2+-binding RTX toxin-like protein
LTHIRGRAPARRALSRLVPAAVLVAVLVAGAAPAQALTCSHDAATGVVTLDVTSPDYQSVSLFRSGEELWFLDQVSGLSAPCADATMASTARIVISGGAEDDDLTFDQTGGPMAIPTWIDLGPGLNRLVIRGTEGPDTITLGTLGIALTATGQPDLTGPSTAQNVAVYGEGGDDDVEAGGGGATGESRPAGVALDGGLGDDRLRGGAAADGIDGGPGNDWIAGGRADDTLRGDIGDDVIYGGDGADTIIGGAGADQAFGGHGPDTFLMGDGEPDLVRGQRGTGDRAVIDVGLDVAFGVETTA